MTAVIIKFMFFNVRPTLNLKKYKQNRTFERNWEENQLKVQLLFVLIYEKIQKYK